MSISMSREELDRAYNNSLAVADSAKIIETWGIASNAVRSENTSHNDLSYGEGHTVSFDFFSAGPNTPVMAFIHGGFWQNRAKSDFTFLVPAILEAGISVAMLGYRLAPIAKMNEIVGDIRTGIRAVIAHVTKQQGQCPDIWLAGWSAGGHLAAMVLDEPGVKGVTAISGIYDLEPMRHCYINDKLALDEKMSKDFSPMRLPQTSKKIIDLFVGGAELGEMQRQTIDFAAYRKQCNAPGTYINLPGLNHYTILDELGQAQGKILASIKAHIL